MTLIYCDECKNLISDKAVTCPHCGAPNLVGNEKCPIHISRKTGFWASARNFTILVNGQNSGSICENGQKTIFVPLGRHSISFVIGKEILCKTIILADPKGVEVVISRGVSKKCEIQVSKSQGKAPNRSSAPPPQSGGGCLLILLLLIFLFLILGITIRFDIFFMPVP